MPIIVHCPGCSQKLKVPDSMAGHRAKCPKCGQVMRFPEKILDAEEVTGTPPAASPPPSSPPPTGILVDDTYPVQTPLGGLTPGHFTDEDFAQPAAPQTSSEPGRHPCPMCGEMIADGAAKCRFCNAVFDPTLRKQEKKKRRRSSGDDDDDLTTSDWLAAILCSGIGCIVGLVYLVQGKPKAGKMIGVSLLFIVLWNVIRFGLVAMNQGADTFR